MQQLEAYPSRPEADSFDFRMTWLGIRHAIRGHKLLIGFTSAMTVLFVVLYIVIWPPIYSASVVLAAESDRDATRDEFYQTWNVFRKDRLSDEVHLVATTPVLEQLVAELHLGDDDVYHTFFAYTTKLWTESLPGKGYKAVKNFIFGRKHGPYDPTPEQIERAKTIVNLRSGVRLETLSDSNVGNLVVLGPSPRVAEMANTLARIYFEERRTRHAKEAEDAYQALAVEATKANTELVALEQRMKKYDVDSGLVLAFEKDKLDINEWAVLKAAIVDHQTAIANASATLAQVNKQLALESPEIVTGRLMTASPARTVLTDRLSQLELSRKQLLIHYRTDAPEVTELERQIEVVREQLAKEPSQIEQQSQRVINEAYQGLMLRRRQLEADLAGQRAALAQRQTEAATYHAAMEKIPEKLEVTHDFDRQHQALEKRYVTLQEKMEVAEISRAAAASAPPSIRIVEQAHLPEKPSWPNVKLLIPGAAVVGLAAGVLLALLMDLINGRVTRFRFATDPDRFSAYAVLDHSSKSAKNLFGPALERTAQDAEGRK